MSEYLRPRQKGASIFFTVNLAQRGSSLLVDHVQALREAVRQTRHERPFAIVAWVVLPDHLHSVWTLPEGDTDYSTRWAVIKARFSRAMPQTAQRASHVARREHGLWQRRFWEHHIRDESDLAAHIGYCWHNPVKHGLVDHPKDWVYSSYHRDA
ncbi:REP-associated tyrosine transposase [Neogemmobacter tilapiae]|uniref:Transposase n=1 Tax=Neogemmobacter tilapiae TaxID=875041 RepID=A0A918WGM1_9RHOB|nr:transposase [Gemmobacter tilapiae]GHC49474.1 transposase [Gemmobacter tilapiae]